MKRDKTLSSINPHWFFHVVIHPSNKFSIRNSHVVPSSRLCVRLWTVIEFAASISHFQNPKILAKANSSLLLRSISFRHGCSSTQRPSTLSPRRCQQPWRLGRQNLVFETSQRYSFVNGPFFRLRAFSLLGRASVLPWKLRAQIAHRVSS